MKYNIVLSVLLFTFSMCMATLSFDTPDIPRPGIIRATIDDGVSVIKVPYGGAIVKPLLPLDNTAPLAFTLLVAGEACAINDPLVLMYQNLTTGNDIILTLPDDMFYILRCGLETTSINLAVRAYWSLKFSWNGVLFVAEQDVCDFNLKRRK